MGTRRSLPIFKFITSLKFQKFAMHGPDTELPPVRNEQERAAAFNSITGLLQEGKVVDATELIVHIWNETLGAFRNTNIIK